MSEENTGMKLVNWVRFCVLKPDDPDHNAEDISRQFLNRVWNMKIEEIKRVLDMPQEEYDQALLDACKNVWRIGQSR